MRILSTQAKLPWLVDLSKARFWTSLGMDRIRNFMNDCTVCSVCPQMTVMPTELQFLWDWWLPMLGLWHIPCMHGNFVAPSGSGHIFAKRLSNSARCLYTYTPATHTTHTQICRRAVKEPWDTVLTLTDMSNFELEDCRCVFAFITICSLLIGYCTLSVFNGEWLGLVFYF